MTNRQLTEHITLGERKTTQASLVEVRDPLNRLRNIDSTNNTRINHMYAKMARAIRTPGLRTALLGAFLLCCGCGMKEGNGRNWPPPLDDTRTGDWSARSRIDLPETERSAEFEGWGSATAGDGGGIYTSGPCLVEGEILVPENIFLIDVLPDLEAKNSFAVVDYGNDYTVIRLERDKGHRLCLGQRGVDEAGIHLESTAALPGACVTVAGQIYEHRPDGWYVEGELACPTQIAPRKQGI